MSDNKSLSESWYKSSLIKENLLIRISADFDPFEYKFLGRLEVDCALSSVIFRVAHKEYSEQEIDLIYKAKESARARHLPKTKKTE